MPVETSSAPTFSLFPSPTPSRPGSQRRRPAKDRTESPTTTNVVQSRTKSPVPTRKHAMKGAIIQIASEAPTRIRSPSPRLHTTPKPNTSQIAKSTGIPPPTRPSTEVANRPALGAPPRTRLPSPPSSPGLYSPPTPLFSTSTAPWASPTTPSKPINPRSLSNQQPPAYPSSSPSTSTTASTTSPSTIFSTSSQTSITTSSPLISSIFPPYNPLLPLQKQHYYPTPTSPPPSTWTPPSTTIRAPYSPDSIGASLPNFRPYQQSDDAPHHNATDPQPQTQTQQPEEAPQKIHDDLHAQILHRDHHHHHQPASQTRSRPRPRSAAHKHVTTTTTAPIPIPMAGPVPEEYAFPPPPKRATKNGGLRLGLRVGKVVAAVRGVVRRVAAAAAGGSEKIRGGR